MRAVSPGETDVEVAFHVPGVAEGQRAALGEAYRALYARLWDEDEAMMRRRQEVLDGGLLRAARRQARSRWDRRRRSARARPSSPARAACRSASSRSATRCSPTRRSARTRAARSRRRRSTTPACAARGTATASTCATGGARTASRCACPSRGGSTSTRAARRRSPSAEGAARAGPPSPTLRPLSDLGLTHVALPVREPRREPRLLHEVRGARAWCTTASTRSDGHARRLGERPHAALRAWC